MPSTIIGSLPSASILTRSIARVSPGQYSSSVVARTATVVFLSRYNARNSPTAEVRLDASKATRFNVSAQSTGGFDRLAERQHAAAPMMPLEQVYLARRKCRRRASVRP